MIHHLINCCCFLLLLFADGQSQNQQNKQLNAQPMRDWSWNNTDRQQWEAINLCLSSLLSRKPSGLTSFHHCHWEIEGEALLSWKSAATEAVGVRTTAMRLRQEGERGRWGHPWPIVFVLQVDNRLVYDIYLHSLWDLWVHPYWRNKHASFSVLLCRGEYVKKHKLCMFCHLEN